MAQRVRVKWNGGAVSASMRAAELRGLRLAGEHVLTESRKEVPIEEGTLERSGTVSVDPGSRRAAVSYNTPYAVVQHERMDFHHDEGRSAKYLERPMTTNRGTVRDIIAQQIRQGLS
ncbi:hypothetical protein CLV30_12822 [Haloactinopolyspora alba]|uniref:HK97 gp10 family phage protein n=1 Tax=Haloactinopolyspora alba TaxID=648780 RepID=A0A2P8DEY3_9ACTN|nr:minor capsid protein [Haloactinopolyspora alba]PSK95770.1 hypothetical protein CLV30_12822 [Haloactinopolyspora alba]